MKKIPFESTNDIALQTCLKMKKVLENEFSGRKLYTLLTSLDNAFTEYKIASIVSQISNVVLEEDINEKTIY